MGNREGVRTGQWGNVGDWEVFAMGRCRQWDVWEMGRCGQ